jgi:hypothetical protein
MMNDECDHRVSAFILAIRHSSLIIHHSSLIIPMKIHEGMMSGE